jgi:hypothetical protein
MSSGFRLHSISARQVESEGKALLRGLPREAKPFTRDLRTNKKFHLSPAGIFANFII